MLRKRKNHVDSSIFLTVLFLLGYIWSGIEKEIECEGRMLDYLTLSIHYSPTRKIAGKHIQQLRFNLVPQGSHPSSLERKDRSSRGRWDTDEEAKVEDIL